MTPAPKNVTPTLAPKLIGNLHSDSCLHSESLKAESILPHQLFCLWPIWMSTYCHAFSDPKQVGSGFLSVLVNYRFSITLNPHSFCLCVSYISFCLMRQNITLSTLPNLKPNNRIISSMLCRLIIVYFMGGQLVFDWARLANFLITRD